MKLLLKTGLLTCLSLLAVCALSLGAQERDAAKTADAAQAKSAKQEAEAIAWQIPSYPFSTCVVGGEALDAKGKAFDGLVEGRLVRTCCEKCFGVLKNNPAPFMEKIDAAIIEQQLPTYPFEKCFVSDEDLDAADKPIDHIHGTRLVRFCCSGCKRAFNKSTEKFMEKLDAALIEKLIPLYPLKTCFISGEDLNVNGKPVDMLYGTRLARVCCKNCAKGFKRNPTSAMERLQREIAKAERGEGGER